MKIVVDGKSYDHDNSRFMVSDARLVKRATGMSPEEFNKGLEADDPDATTALVWLLRRRAGETDLAFDDVDFDLATLQVIPDPPDPTQADLATSGSASDASPST